MKIIIIYIQIIVILHNIIVTLKYLKFAFLLSGFKVGLAELSKRS